MIKTTDYYSSFWELFQSEPKQNYEIFLQDTSTFCSFFAIHWGKIEPGTDDLVSYFLDKGYSGYIFAGKKRWNNKKLHITSVHYDDVSAQTLAFKSKLLFSFHGCKWQKAVIYIGGKNLQLKKQMYKALSWLQWCSVKLCVGEDMFSAEQDENIVNFSSGGIQLELSKGFRKKLFTTSFPFWSTIKKTPFFFSFCSLLESFVESVLTKKKL